MSVAVSAEPIAPVSPPRLPWATLAAAVVALAAMFVSSGGLPMLLFYGVLVVFSYLSPARIPDRSPVRWVALALLAAAAWFSVPPADAANATYDQIGPARNRNLFALFCGAEMTVLFWRGPNTTGDKAQGPLAVLLLSSLVFLSASNTFDDRYIRLFAPLYLLCAGISLRSYRLRPHGSRVALVLRSISLLVALLLGAASYRTVAVYRGNLNELVNRMSSFTPQPPEAIGMAAQPSLGPLFDLRGSPARVLRMENFGGDAHWRGLSYDTYNRGVWGPSVRERAYKEADDRILQPARANSLPRQETIAVSRLTSGNPLVYGPLSATQIEKGDAENVQQALGEGGPIRTPRRGTPVPYEYSVTISEGNERYQGIFAVPLSKESRTRALQVPDDFSPDVRLLAQTIAGKQAVDKARIGAVVNYLLTHHKYSLQFSRNTGAFPDPLADFLLSRPAKGAHCEFFAASACLLLRCVGVPTRYVTGYYVHEGGKGPKESIVRQRDAHAWCEAWVNGTGWVVVDATPGDGRPDGLPQEVEGWRKLWEGVQDAAQTFSDFIANLTPAQANAGIVLVVAAVLGYGVWVYTKGRRKNRAAGAGTAFTYSSPNAALAALAARFEKAWQNRTSSPFPPQKPYTEHLAGWQTADGTPPVSPEFVAQAQTWASQYERARFGKNITDADIDNLRDLLKPLEEK